MEASNQMQTKPNPQIMLVNYRILNI
jgi:hypothetical protein